MPTLELERTSLSIDDIADKVYAGERLTWDDGRRLMQHHNLPELGALADHVRQRLNPGDIVTYVVGRNVNYTNVCWVRCKFCAFYRVPGHEEGYTLSRDEIFEKIQQMVDLGGIEILMQGGLNPSSRSSGMRTCSHPSRSGSAPTESSTTPSHRQSSSTLRASASSYWQTA
jgi:cyclic dehypoxanthinyl futalosine synthase